MKWGLNWLSVLMPLKMLLNHEDRYVGENTKKEKQFKNYNKSAKFNLVRVELTFNADERDNAPGIPMKFEG